MSEHVDPSGFTATPKPLSSRKFHMTPERDAEVTREDVRVLLRKALSMPNPSGQLQRDITDDLMDKIDAYTDGRTPAMRREVEYAQAEMAKAREETAAVVARETAALQERAEEAEGERDDLDTACGSLIGENVELEQQLAEANERLAKVRALLDRPDGAPVDELIAALGGTEGVGGPDCAGCPDGPDCQEEAP